MTYIKSNTLFEGLHTEEIYKQNPRPIILADQLTTPENMGALIRISDNIGASEMCFLGQEPTNSMRKVRRSAASSRDNIKWYFTCETNLRKIIGNKTLIAIETANNATNIFNTELPVDAAFLVGNESEGMRPEILAQADMVVYIPVPGPTRSLNVSHAAAVAVFEWYRQLTIKNQ